MSKTEFDELFNEIYFSETKKFIDSLKESYKSGMNQDEFIALMFTKFTDYNHHLLRKLFESFID